MVPSASAPWRRQKEIPQCEHDRSSQRSAHSRWPARRSAAARFHVARHGRRQHDTRQGHDDRHLHDRRFRRCRQVRVRRHRPADRWSRHWNPRPGRRRPDHHLRSVDQRDHRHWAGRCQREADRRCCDGVDSVGTSPDGAPPAGAPTLVVTGSADGTATEAGTSAGGAGETTQAGQVPPGLPPIAIDSVDARPGTAEECAAMKPTTGLVPPPLAP